MAMGRRKREQQGVFFVTAEQLPRQGGHPFYERVNQILGKCGFDDFVERACASCYAEKNGRPSIAPGIYFRMLMIGYFEGIDSERGIAWRVADSLSLRSFLGLGLTEATPEHSSLSRIRNRLDVALHEKVFQFVLVALGQAGLLKGKTIGIDATTLEANAALRSLVRRDTGVSYQDYLKKLAQAAGNEEPTREDLAKLDKNRKNKGNNDDWQNPYDPDAKITKMKDGRTHLAHKAEHAVDFASGAVVAVTVQPANEGDTTTWRETVETAYQNLNEVKDDPHAAQHLNEKVVAEVVNDKGYHSNQVMADLREIGIRSYTSEPDRGRRDWEGKAQARQAVYANRRRIRGKRGKQLLRQRGELVERSFAHVYETGRMRRTHLKGHEKITKRLLIHVAAFNLGLLMRTLFKVGTPRTLQDGGAALCRALRRLWQALRRSSRAWWSRYPTRCVAVVVMWLTYSAPLPRPAA